MSKVPIVVGFDVTEILMLTASVLRPCVRDLRPDFMSITAIAVLAAIFVPFGLIGAAVIWCAREDAVRGRRTHHQNPRTRFRAF